MAAGALTLHQTAVGAEAFFLEAVASVCCNSGRCTGLAEG
jgi:hypothetical protein